MSEYGTVPEAQVVDQPKRRSSHVFVGHEDSHEQLNGVAPANVHNDFVKKVYGILVVQLLYTAAICSVMMFVPAVRNGALSFAIHHPNVLQITLLVCLFSSLCWLRIAKDRYPQNVVACAVFVTFISINVGLTCAIYYAAGAGKLILLSVLITAAMFLGLSSYAWLSSADFEYMRGFLFAALLGVLILGIVQCFLHLPWLEILYCILGILVFSGYIVYDTYLIKTKLGPDDALMASIELYLDIINLFLLILDLLGSRR